MPVIALIELFAQVYFAVHAIRTGKDSYWVYIIIFFPGVGCLIYFFAEYLPELHQGNNIARSRKQKMSLSYLEDQVELSPSLKNKKALAEGYINKGLFDKAIKLYDNCLDGLHEDDPTIIEGLCCAYFFKGDLKNAESYLTKLRKIRNSQKSDEFDLLLARTYEGLGETEKALAEYSELIKNFTGEEARCRYAALLEKLGSAEEANGIYQEIVKNARLSPKFYQQRQKQWIDIARKQVK